MGRKQLTRNDLEREPYLAWNGMLEVLGTEYPDLTPIQLVARLALTYDGSVQNGGHLQYFENYGTEHLNETLTALKTIGAECQHDVLSAAAKRRFTRPRFAIRTVRQYVAIARKREYEAEDKRYYACRPEICTALLEKFLAAHFDEFIDIIED